MARTISPLTVLAVLVMGTTTYYFARQSFERVAEAKQTNTKKPRWLLPILWIGTGATASGALAALWASRTIRLATTTVAVAQEARKELEERTQLLTNATENIRSSLNQEDIFQAAVQEARQVIAADRVLVYSLDEQSQGRVIAESVATGWPKALGATIDDPCFSAHYLEKYQNGRVQAIDDIYTAHLTPCHLAQLEPFAVKANLVAPILNQGQLMGLLIAHQCSGPRAWQQFEILGFMQIARQVSTTIDKIRHLREVTQISQAILTQIPALADCARSALANAQQVQLQVEQTSQTGQAGAELAYQIVNDLSHLQEDMTQATLKVKYLGQSSPNISHLVNLINDLVTQINLQRLNTIIKANRAEGVAQESSVSSLSTEPIDSLREQLAEATTAIQSWITNIATEVNDLAATMEAKTEEVIKGTDLAKETRQKLHQIDTVTAEMSTLLNKIVQAAAQGAQTSASAHQALLSTKSLAHKLDKELNQPPINNLESEIQLEKNN